MISFSNLLTKKLTSAAEHSVVSIIDQTTFSNLYSIVLPSKRSLSASASCAGMVDNTVPDDDWRRLRLYRASLEHSRYLDDVIYSGPSHRDRLRRSQARID